MQHTPFSYQAEGLTINVWKCDFHSLNEIIKERKLLKNLSFKIDINKSKFTNHNQTEALIGLHIMVVSDISNIPIISLTISALISRPEKINPKNDVWILSKYAIALINEEIEEQNIVYRNGYLLSVPPLLDNTDCFQGEIAIC